MNELTGQMGNGIMHGFGAVFMEALTGFFGFFFEGDKVGRGEWNEDRDQ
jgi:hypothetical protein